MDRQNPEETEPLDVAFRRWWTSPASVAMAEPDEPVSWLRANAWALAVALLYMALLVMLLAPLVWVGFVDGVIRSSNHGLDAHLKFIFSFWEEIEKEYDKRLIPVAILGAFQWALLAIPVARMRGRPVRKRHVIWVALCASALAAGLFVAVYINIGDADATVQSGLTDSLDVVNRFTQKTCGLPVLVLWGIWFLVIYRWSLVRDAGSWYDKVLRWLFAGSVLELTVALPAHIIARWRNDCCAGFGTFIGLATGMALALMAFGPAFLLMIWQRWREKRRADRPRRDASGSA